ncbi:MAG: sugar kinase [Roseiarcus sp.]|jgi:sugar/nucleoside kinase (ribokinase family)
MPQFDVSVVGLTILDILGRPVNVVPEKGGVAFIDQIRLTVAGPAGGTAIDAAKLGLKTRLVGAVGRDEKGDFIRAVCARHGVDAQLLATVDGRPTSATILPIRANGERPALHNRGASDAFRLRPAEFAEALDARYVHVGGTGLLAAFDGEPTRAFLVAAKAAGRVTSFDLIAVGPEHFDLVAPLLPHIDYFLPSHEEASALSGRGDPLEAAQFFLDRGVATVAVTLGERGSLIASRGGKIHRLPAFDVPVVDTTGCGDAYSAGFIAGLAHGFDLPSAGRFASAAAALVATGLGSDAGIVSFEATARAAKTLQQRV